MRAQRDQAPDPEAYLNDVIRAYFRFLIDEPRAAMPGRPLADRLPAVRIGTPAQRAVFEEVRSSLAHALGREMAPEAADTDYLAAAAIGVARYVGQQMLRREPPDPEGAADFAVRMILHGLPAAAAAAAARRG